MCCQLLFSADSVRLKNTWKDLVSAVIFSGYLKKFLVKNTRNLKNFLFVSAVDPLGHSVLCKCSLTINLQGTGPGS